MLNLHGSIADVLRALFLSSSTKSLVASRSVCRWWRDIVDGEPHVWGQSERWVRRWWRRNHHTICSNIKCLPFSPIVRSALVERFQERLKQRLPGLCLNNLPEQGFIYKPLSGFKPQVDKIRSHNLKYRPPTSQIPSLS